MIFMDYFYRISSDTIRPTDYESVALPTELSRQ